MVALMSALVPSLLTRRRIAAGTVAPEARAPRLPRNLLPRVLLVALVATILLGGCAVAILASVWNGALDFSTILTLKIAYGALVGAIVTPMAIREALAD
jgi:hypothetical protein